MELLIGILIGTMLVGGVAGLGVAALWFGVIKPFLPNKSATETPPENL